ELAFVFLVFGDVSHVFLPSIAPGIQAAFGAARRQLPLLFGRQPLVRPLGILVGVFPTHVGHGQLVITRRVAFALPRRRQQVTGGLDKFGVLLVGHFVLV